LFDIIHSTKKLFPQRKIVETVEKLANALRRKGFAVQGFPQPSNVLRKNEFFEKFLPEKSLLFRAFLLIFTVT